MRLPSARRLAPTCIVSVAALAALAAPGAANATLGTQCSGSNITAQGSSLQKDAQLNVWNPGFNTSIKSKSACAGAKGQGTLAKPTVTYTSTGSGAGLEAWGVNKKTPNYTSNAFVGTDEPPNAAQLGEIEANESKLTPETVLSIPVAQESVAVMMHLPANCVATSKKNKGRLELTNVALEGIYRGTITKWSQLQGVDGNALSGAGCNAESAIIPVVRKDQSGTTHIFKKYLSLISGTTFLTEAPKEQNKTWTEVSEGPESTTWPKSANVTKPAATGGGALVEEVSKTAGSIGYANLAEARLKGTFTPGDGGGPGTATFWAPVQDNGLGTEKPKFQDPASNKDVAALAEANCKNTEYTNSVEAFPPLSVTEPWNEVTTSTTEKKYTLCGLTYDLGLTSFSSYPGTSQEEATTAHDYLKFVVDAKGGGGQKILSGHDYLALPKGPVLSEAQKGAEKISF
jgi:ABC-type phosphate transport system substrate-binding protein